MEHETIGEGIAQSLEKYLFKADRFNELLSKNLQKLEKQESGISEALPKITLEVEELKNIRENFSSVLGEKIKEVLLKESHTLGQTLSASFLEKTETALQVQQKIYEESLSMVCNRFREEIKLAKNDLEQCLERSSSQSRDISQECTSSLNKITQNLEETFKKYSVDAEQFKREMESVVSSLKKLMNLQKQRLTRKGLMVCSVFCLSSALTGATLFYFFPQTVYYPDINTAKNIIMGKSVWDNMKHLSMKDQNILLDGMKK